MSNQIAKLLAVMVISMTLLTFTAAAQVTYAQNATSISLQAKPDKGDKGNNKEDKGNKGDKGAGGKDNKKPKSVQNVKISADIDLSQVENATEAAEAYTFMIQSGTFVSKPKTLELGNGTEMSDTATLNFNGKLKVSPNDGFTITAASEEDGFNTVSAIGSFTEEPQGKSGKTTLVGSLSEPLALQENAVEGLE